jgi:hypothetical protein
VPWLKQREVHVHTRAELQAALRRAERIVVEGDASLTAYAAQVAGVSAPSPQAGPRPLLKPLDAAERAAHPPRSSKPPRLWPWVAGAFALAIGAAAAVLLEHFSQASSRLSAAPAAAAADPIKLAAPAAAVAVLLALFFLAKHLIGGQSHGRASWQLENPAHPAGAPLVLARLPSEPA